MRPPLLREHELTPSAVDAALRDVGGFFLRLSSASALMDSMLSASHSFFALPTPEKASLAIERSAHFRGWSELRNERDCREQLHLGRERAAALGEPSFLRLHGPNLWPADTGWREVVSRYLDRIAELGQHVLEKLAPMVGMDPATFDKVRHAGYLVAKLIGYHPQRVGESRPGVAPHVDFSWLTITLQDGEGLEIRLPGGGWRSLGAPPGAVWIHAGELLEHASHGRYAATPHRVVNRSRVRTRVSIPVFINPPLDALVPVFPTVSTPTDRRAKDLTGEDATEHVHRVLEPRGEREPFHFGAAEWRRKGLGGWCFACRPLPAS